MSRYILELKDDVQVVQKVGVTENGNAFVMNFYKDQLEELNSDYINEHYGELWDTAYLKGFKDGKAVNDKGCEGCKYANVAGTHEPCVRCSNSYGNQWTAKDDKFEFGDEIIDKWGIKGCVVSRDNEESDTMYALFDGYKTPQCITKRNYRKTGKHYDIEKILEEMRK